VRSSIQCSPKSPDTIWHAFSKSCVISSLITASLNGHVSASAAAARDAFTEFTIEEFDDEHAAAFLARGGIAASSAANPRPASTLRRVYTMLITSS
jgi:hypothetical protein